MMMSRLKLYVVGSAFMANVVLLRAYYERPNFYSAAVYISQSTGSLMFLVNVLLIIAASFGYGLQRLFYGPLRPIETEQLYDKAWFAVSETLLAMTIFRDDIGMWFFAMFLLLLAGKIWQWIGEGRVEILEQQPPANPKLFHTRLMSSLLLSVAFDIFMMQYCVDSILSDTRPGVMVMFGFEYVLLAIASVSTLLRYTLSLVELFITHRQEKAKTEAQRVAREARQQAVEGQSEETAEAEDDDDEGDVPGWEEKGRWVFYLDLTTDFIKSIVYLGFFMILMTFYGIPIHIMRDLFMTLRSFFKRINDFIQYRNATRDMNTRYPDATTEELERENTCIVCREEMRPWTQPGAEGTQPNRRMDERQRPKKLPCGHILHFSCLRSWLERQQVCPTCRRPVLAPNGTQNAPRNNQGVQGQQNQQNPQGQGGLQALLRMNGGQVPPGHQGQDAQQAGGGNQPAGNLRVFNFGPFRIALGNLRIPAERRNNPNDVRDMVNQLQNQAAAGAAAQNPTQQIQPEPAMQPLMPIAAAGLPPVLGALAEHPADIQSDILRIQRNIIESMRQLNLQHEQLGIIHRLLAELNRIQQASGIAAANGQELPLIAPLPPANLESFTPQAYFARGPLLRHGDTGVPEGLTLPEGWTLRPMALAPQPNSDSGVLAARPPQPSLETRSSSRATTSTTTTASSPEQSLQSAAKPAEPSSLESSWSFGHVNGRDEVEGSSSAVSGNGSADQNVTKRSVTVEDAEENS